MVARNVTVGIEVLSGFKIGDFVDYTAMFDESIYIEVGEKRVNGKSVIGLMSLGLSAGDRVTLLVNGKNEGDVVKKIEEFIV